MGFEPKKLALLRILQILEEKTDAEHPLTQDQIRQKLEQDYGIKLERKAISANLSLLKEAGYEIESDRRRGSYMQTREFDDAEIRVLIDAVRNSGHITKEFSEELVGRLEKLAGPGFHAAMKHNQTARARYKTDNQEVYTTLESIDTAIEKGYQISFQYESFGLSRTNGRPVLRTHSVDNASPYGLILYNQRYYLKLYRGSVQRGFFEFDKLDRIKNLTIHKDLPVIPPDKIDQRRAYFFGNRFGKIPRLMADMVSERIGWVELVIKKELLDDLIDTFGSGCVCSKTDSPLKIKVRFAANIEAVKQWILLHLSEAEILSPSTLLVSFVSSLRRQLEKYQNK